MKKWVAAAIIMTIVLGLAVVMLPILMLSTLSSSRSSSCAPGADAAAVAGAQVAPTDPGVLADVQRGHARTIVATGEQMGFGEQGVVVALSTALQESGLRMLANDGSGVLEADQVGVDRSLQYPHDGVGNDHGSVNFFQQQFPWWGTLDELMNPQTAAVKFYEALRKVSGWEALPVTVAAQQVQSSAYPEAYADDEPMARQLYGELRGAGRDAPPLPVTVADPEAAIAVVGDGFSAAAQDVLCGSGLAMNCAPTSNPAEKGLTPDALRVMRCITAEFGERPWANVGERPSGVDRDHQEGRAVDAMMTQGEDDYRTPGGRAKGDRIADWVVAHADALGVKYVIWYEKIWTRTGDGVGSPGAWGPYDYPLGGNSTDTVAHRDHVHVSVYGNSAVGTEPGSGSGEPGMPLDPGTYTLTSGYGPRSNPTGSGTQFHAGQDFGAPEGSPIYATHGGTVTASGDAGDGYGTKIVIANGNTTWLYGHMVAGSAAVPVGATVTAGQRIGALGSTGDSTGAHLHYEVRVDGASVDPMPYLKTHVAA